MRIRPFEPPDEAAVVDLWQRCGLTRPWNDPRKDIARKLAVQHQKRGLGRTLMREVEKRLLERGCPKLNVQVRTSNDGALRFYRRLVYAQDEAVALGKRLIPDA
jgi:GNAT superfamily N-acetyltransferase